MHRELDQYMSATQGKAEDKEATVLPPYLEAVLKESMRKYPTASTGSMREVCARKSFECLFSK